MPEATTPTRKPPAPVLHARQAIALLRAEDAGQAALVEKILPGYALSLARAGENVTVETLLAAAQMGPAHLKRQSHAPAPEDTLDAYHRIVANFDPYLGKTTQEKLVIACKKGDTGRVQDCIGQGADITANTNEAVRAAARAGHTEIVKFLIDQGADITADNNEALTSAAGHGRTEIVKFLLDHGADITACNNEAVKVAARGGHTETVKLLIDRGADIKKGPDLAVRDAATAGHTETLKLLIDHGADITAHNHEALKVAAIHGHIETVKLLIDHGADVTANDNQAVIAAAYCGHTEIVKFLIKHGVDIKADAKGIIRVAAGRGYTEILKILVGYGADITAKDNEAIRAAATDGHTETIKFLIDQGADVTAMANEAVRTAARHGHTETVKLLIDHGADITAENNEAFRAAARDGHTETVKLLIDYGADIKASANEVLIWAAGSGYTETVKLLIDHGADVTANASANETLRIAASRGYTETVKLLIDHGADVTANNNQAIKAAAHFCYAETVKLLIDHGADITALPEDSRKTFEDLIKREKLWQKTVHMTPPPGLHNQNPSFFKKSVFEALVPLLAQEGYRGQEGAVMAFQAAGLFQSTRRVLQYLERWGTAGRQPLHDLIQMIALPESGSPNLKDWGDGVLKCGPSMARLVKFSDRIPSPCKSKDGQTWSMINTKAECAKFVFRQAAEHPALATLCFEFNVDESAFNEALRLTKKIKPAAKTIPEITISGQSFEMEGAKFYRLPPHDIRGLFLGEMTDCCQSIGGVGSPCARHGYTSPDSGFYVVENAKGKIVGQSWAWRGTKDELCFDSLETLGKNVTSAQWQKIVGAVARDLDRRQDHGITALVIGAGGNTPKDTLCQKFSVAASNAQPKGYNGYRDSKKEQILAWKRSIG